MSLTFGFWIAPARIFRSRFARLNDNFFPSSTFSNVFNWLVFAKRQAFYFVVEIDVWYYCFAWLSFNCWNNIYIKAKIYRRISGYKVVYNFVKFVEMKVNFKFNYHYINFLWRKSVSQNQVFESSLKRLVVLVIDLQHFIT